MRFDLRPEDQQLIDAVIRCGDWLAVYPATTHEQARIIRVLQGALRRLPEDSPQVYDVSYGFAFRHATGPAAGVYQSWEVSFFRRTATAAPWIEIFNIYSTPDGDLLEDDAHETAVEFIGGYPNGYTSTWDRLIAQFSRPPDLPPGTDLEVRAALVEARDSPAPQV